ncbi:hypothetical protein [Cellulomonas sp. ICMP 17802]|uniref:hypothetical protein n=1 Tax=Cellulomonas sp. ICMP 17802 TaxID=3239199 RepID=UPI00351B2397
MTTSEPDRPVRTPPRTLSDRRFLVACACGLTAVGLLWLTFTLAGQSDTAAGALVGGGGILAAAAVVRWRARRRGSSPDGGVSRTVLGTADERDKTILTASLAWVGLAALLANAVGLAAVALGADASTVIGAIEAALLAVLVAALLVLSRRL